MEGTQLHAVLWARRRLRDGCPGFLAKRVWRRSGKSTTLYAALQYLNCKEKNILTLEDPIEYQLEGISRLEN